MHGAALVVAHDRAAPRDVDAVHAPAHAEPDLGQHERPLLVLLAAEAPLQPLRLESGTVQRLLAEAALEVGLQPTPQCAGAGAAGRAALLGERVGERAE